MTRHEDTEVKPIVSKDKVSEIRERKSTTKTASQIIHQVFSISLDKDGNIKPANLTKTDSNLIIGCKDASGVNASLAEQIVNDALKTDPLLDSLAQLTAAASQCRDEQARVEILTFCVRLASALWINRHEGSIDLYNKILEQDKGLDASPLATIQKSVSEYYFKRINKSRSIEQVICDSDAAIAITQLTTEQLEKQRDNILMIGGLWLLSKGGSIPEAITFFANLVKKNSSPARSQKDIALFLAKQFAESDKLLADTMGYFADLAKEKADRGVHLLNALDHSKKLNTQLEAELNASKTTEHSHLEEIKALKVEVAKLHNSLEELQLDERAKRTHLRDDTGQIKGRAFNLLTEDIQEPLMLSLSALQREKPKLEVAIYHVELAVQSIERNIKWFKE